MANNNLNDFNNNDASYLRELMADEETHSLMDYVNIIRHHQLAVLLISLAVLALAILYAATATDIYKASTMLKISEPQGSILDASSFLPEFAGGGKADRFIANEIETIKNITIREKVATVIVDSFAVGMNKDLYSLILNKDYFDSKDQSKLKSYDDIVELLEKKVSIEQKRGLDFIEVSVQSPSPKEAALIANTYANVYREFNLLDNRKQVSKVKEFLARQKDEKLNELINAEDDLTTYQLKGGVIELDEQAKSLIETMANLESKINSAAIDMSIAKENLIQFKEEFDRKNPTLSSYLVNKSSEPYVLKLQEEIASLEARKDIALATKQRIKNPRVIKEFDEKMTELKERLKSKNDEFQSSLLASTPEEIKVITQRIFEERVRYEAARASHNQLKKFIKGYETKFDKLPENTIDLARLSRQAISYEKLYLLLEEKYQGALITEQSTTGNVLQLNTARVPREPSKPNRKLIILIGLVLGLGLAFGYALLMNYFDRTVKSPDDIEGKNINLLGWVPKVEESKMKGHGSEFIVANNSDSVASEAFKALRTRIRYSKIEGDAKTILITSSAPGEGKSTVSANLAGSFALSNRRTVIVDCDLRKPRVHNIFNQKRFPGFTDYFVGRATFEEIQRTSDIENLSFIPAGTIPPNPSEILDSRGMKSFVRKLSNEFDIVILDSPPVLTVTDAEILSRIVDETILVVSANKTDIELMSKAVALLKHGEDSSFIGALLNRFEVQSSYGSYYKYAYTYARDNGKEKKKTKKISKPKKEKIEKVDIT